jgi:hypothetical protein
MSCAKQVSALANLYGFHTKEKNSFLHFELPFSGVSHRRNSAPTLDGFASQKALIVWTPRGMLAEQFGSSDGRAQERSVNVSGMLGEQFGSSDVREQEQSLDSNGLLGEQLGSSDVRAQEESLDLDGMLEEQLGSSDVRAPEQSWDSVGMLGEESEPSEVEGQEKNHECHGNEEVYTVMMKNIPCSCKQEEIKDAIVAVGFGESYNFFYAPSRCGKSRGYAFVGFPSSVLRDDFSRSMTGYTFVRRNSRKVIEIAPASIQGGETTWHHFKDTYVMKTPWKPSFRRRASSPARCASQNSQDV